MKKLLTLVVLAAVGVAGTTYILNRRSQASSAQPRLAKIDRGSIIEKMSATGRLILQDVAVVGTEVSAAKVEDVLDSAKVGAQVKKDDALLKLDSTLASANFENAEAAFTTAEADLLRAEAAKIAADAGLGSAESKRDLAKHKLARLNQNAADVNKSDKEDAEKLVLDAEANTKLSQAQVKQADAAIKAAQSNVAKAQASVKVAKVGVDLMTVKAPIDGIIIFRNVVKGQPISAQGTPVLFLIAPDLRRLQIQAQVGESDISKIKPNMTARFTIDALAEEHASFPAKVSHIPIMPVPPPSASRAGSLSDLATSLPGPVLFTVTLDVVAPEGKSLPDMKPGLSANVDFIVNEVKDVLSVPNQALTYRPESLSADDQKRIQEKVAAGYKPIWVKNGNSTTQIVFIQTGATDGMRTAVTQSEGELKENMDVIIEAAPRKGGIFDQPLKIGIS